MNDTFDDIAFFAFCMTMGGAAVIMFCTLVVMLALVVK
jgi:hypothetical protein